MMTDEYVTSAERYCVPHEAVAAVFAMIPPSLRRRPKRLRDEIRDAIVKVRRSGEANAVSFIQSRLNAYLRSHEGTHSYYRELYTWFDDEGYFESKSAWASREVKAANARNAKERDTHNPNV